MRNKFVKEVQYFKRSVSVIVVWKFTRKARKKEKNRTTGMIFHVFDLYTKIQKVDFR